jgi:hypothetical protein
MREPVGVEDGDEEESGAVEELALRAAHGHVAQEHQPRVLAVDLTRVNARLGEDDRLVRAPQRLRGEGPLLRGDHQPDVPPLGTLANRHHLQLPRSRHEATQVRDRLVVIGRGAELPPLGRSDPRIVRRHDQPPARPIPRDGGREDGGVDGGGKKKRRQHDGPS